jgi:hypothetical protein
LSLSQTVKQNELELLSKISVSFLVYH